MGIGRLIDIIHFEYIARLTYLRRVNPCRREWVSYNWLKKHISWSNVNREFEDVFNNDVLINETIFVYWKQGYDNMPPIVKICVDSIINNRGQHPVVFLDENNIKEYVHFPQYICDYYKKRYIGEAFFSDLLRVSLLIKYGGYWCDATCMMVKEFPNYVEKNPFFMFSRSLLSSYYSPIEGSSWFIKGNQGNVLLVKVRNFLFEYCRHKPYLINYYLFHLVLSVLIKNDEKCKFVWQDMPYVCNMNPHLLQGSFSKSYSEELFSHILEQSFVQKLTYKYDTGLLKSPKENILQHILQM